MPTNYFDAVDYPAILDEYPYDDRFLKVFRGMSHDELRTRQDARFQRVLTFAWKVPFYRRLWGSRGIEPGDIRSLDDACRLPTYSKSDLMASVDAHPPIGDFHGLNAHSDSDKPPLIFQTTSGTTGNPQPLLFGPKSREVQALMLGRLYRLQGLTRQDVVHSVYGHGMVNGGHYVREAITHWLCAQLLTAGTGVETRSDNQVSLMHRFGATAIVGFGDYIKRLATVARDQGLEPGRDIPVRIISGHLGAESRESMSTAWGGAEVFDWYGVGDTGCIAGEGHDRQGLHILEDAHFLELLQIDSDAPVGDGEPGDMVCTCLYKDDIFPIIRFRTHDVSQEILGDNPLGIPFRRLKGFLGRSDQMVKLRGINLYPQGIGSLISDSFAAATGEFVCRVTRSDGRDEMSVTVEATQHSDALKEAIESHLLSRLGVRIFVELADPGGTASDTRLESRQKPIRLIDER